MVARKAPYGRGSHGELMTAPDSSIAPRFKTAAKVVLIDRCFLHGDIFDVEDMPENERMAAARQAADYVLTRLNEGKG